MYYKTLRSIPPGTEMFVWYGNGYGETLNITLFKRAPIHYAEGKNNKTNCSVETKLSIYVCNIILNLFTLSKLLLF